MSKIPTQMYIPTNFSQEVQDINNKCKILYINGGWRLVDKDGNIYTIDYSNCTVSVN